MASCPPNFNYIDYIYFIKLEFINTNLAKSNDVLFLEVSAMAKVTDLYGFSQVYFMFQLNVAILFIMQSRIIMRMNRT